jgi:hypothetical protein
LEVGKVDPGPYLQEKATVAQKKVIRLPYIGSHFENPAGLSRGSRSKEWPSRGVYPSGYLPAIMYRQGRLPPLSRPKSMSFKVESVLKKTSFYPFKTVGSKPPREYYNESPFVSKSN